MKLLSNKRIAHNCFMHNIRLDGLSLSEEVLWGILIWSSIVMVLLFLCLLGFFFLLSQCFKAIFSSPFTWQTFHAWWWKNLVWKKPHKRQTYSCVWKLLCTSIHQCPTTLWKLTKSHTLKKTCTQMILWRWWVWFRNMKDETPKTPNEDKFLKLTK